MAATANPKLTEILKGRSISGTSDSGGEKSISFTDGSTLSVKVSQSNSNSASTGGTVVTARQSDNPPVLYLDLENGTTVEIPLVEAAASVTLWGKDNSTEYTD